MKKLLEFSKKNLFSISVAGLILIFFIINYSTLSTNLRIVSSHHEVLYKILYIVAMLVFSVIAFLLVRKINRKENNYPKIFVVFALVMGIIYLLLSPLFTGSDEAAHFYRIYEITEGNISTPVDGDVIGSQMPTSLQKVFDMASGDGTKVKYRDIPSMLKVPLNSEGKQLYSTHLGASFYSPVSYTPQLVGFEIGKIFNAGPYIIGMLGRLFNLVFYILIGYFAIKMVPKGKLFYLLVFLSPNMLQLATTLSADVLTNALIMLLLALVMKVRLGDKIISRKQEILIAALGVAISLCKISYAPFVALIFLIKKDQYKKGVKEKYIFTISVIILSAILTLLWMKGASEILSVVYPNSELQKSFVLSQPIDYLVVLFRTTITTFVQSIEELFVGSRMYCSQLIIPAVVSFGYVGLVVYASRKKEKSMKAQLSILERSLIGLGCLVVFGVILTALYLQATALVMGVGYPVVFGLQGRYFIPIILCLPFVIKWKRPINIDDKKVIELAIVTSLIVWSYMLVQFII